MSEALMSEGSSIVDRICNSNSTSGPRRHIYLDAHISSTFLTPTKTLQDLLADTQILTRRRRYCLALTLASSYLQLGATPWLNTQLRKDNIIFLQDQTNPDTTILNHPYLRCEIFGDVSNQPSRRVGEEAGLEFAEPIDWKDLLQHVIVPLDTLHKQVSQKPWSM
ncbi:hypothetical protein BU25DRAFT_440835 [Macroventuria anomochaeta]|uniref:Uncharacterized protein n=1 Tax=Macroventuria anomochaeta TaxID=301207 RepID=A0ACB6RVP3_9PLEO|nr:uncharacterized protein BU25DRAFT_440835 [Macroventuria anomochaeta]KAF2626075.1 hypothetical protein BU25DRAFT_440835 [Macroventuria anomochaeta]